MRFAIFPLHLSKVLRLPRKIDARFDCLRRRLEPARNLLALPAKQALGQLRTRAMGKGADRSDAPKCNPSQKISALTS